MEFLFNYGQTIFKNIETPSQKKKSLLSNVLHIDFVLPNFRSYSIFIFIPYQMVNFISTTVENLK